MIGTAPIRPFLDARSLPPAQRRCAAANPSVVKADHRTHMPPPRSTMANLLITNERLGHRRPPLRGI